MSKKVLKVSKPPTVLHSEDWNSRFWVDKIPEYNKVGSAVGENRIKLPTRLPKIYSASLAKMISPGKGENEVSSSHKDLNLSIKTEQISEIKPIPSPLPDKHPFLNGKPRPKILAKDEPKPGKNSNSSVKRTRKIVYKHIKERETRETVKKGEKPGHILTSKSVEPKNSRVALPKVSQSALSTAKPPEEERLHTEEITEQASESEESEQEELSLYSSKLCSDLISESVHLLLTELGSESVNEALLAYLQLSSNKILFMYIMEVLDDFIPSVAKSAYIESKEKEPSEFRDEIANEVFNDELWRVVQTINIEKISITIAFDYLQLLPLEGYVIECIEESQKETLVHMKIVLEDLIVTIIDEEWVEVLVEDVINSIRIEENWSLFPPNVQKEVNKKQKAEIIEILAERVYFDALHEIVSGIWVRSICEKYLEAIEEGYVVEEEVEEEEEEEEEEEDIETLMPIPKFVPNNKKSSL